MFQELKIPKTYFLYYCYYGLVEILVQGALFHQWNLTELFRRDRHVTHQIYPRRMKILGFDWSLSELNLSR